MDAFLICKECKFAVHDIFEPLRSTVFCKYKQQEKSPYSSCKHHKLSFKFGTQLRLFDFTIPDFNEL